MVISEGRGSLDEGSLTVDESPIGLTEIGPDQEFESYLVKIDNPDAATPEDYEASLQFDGQILGIQKNVSSLRPGRHTLDADDDFEAGAPAGGIEDNDTVAINGDTVSLDGKVGGQGVDPIRVFVAAVAVPEATSIAVWGSLFIAGTIGYRRGRDS